MQSDFETSFVKGKPMRLPTADWKPPKWVPMSAEWKKNVEDKWWATNYKGGLTFSERELMPLRERLLSFGGEEVCLPWMEEDLAGIMSRGELWPGVNIKKIAGKVCRCHENAALAWQANRSKFRMATGYYMSREGGMWRAHTWLIRTTKSGGRVVETTRPSLLYYGFILTDEEANERLAHYI